MCEHRTKRSVSGQKEAANESKRDRYQAEKKPEETRKKPE